MSTQDLIAKFDRAVAEVGEVLIAYPWDNAEAYGAWLSQQYRLVKNTTRFICLAAGNVDMDQREAHYDWIGHLKGELNHDLVAQNDLKALGMAPTKFPELTETQLIMQSQYYFLDRGRPLGLTGYALLLEGLAAKIGPIALAKAEPAHGKEATGFLRLHCKVDIGHYAEGLKGLEHLTEADQRETERNLLQSQMLYISLVKSLAAKYGTKRTTTQLRAAA